MADEERTLGDADGWNRRYVEGTDRWTLDAPPRVIAELAAGELLDLSTDPRRVLIPGAGTGADAEGWARAGHEVVALDWAELAVEAMKARREATGLSFTPRREDIFALPDDLRGTFDVVWEQTCFCAIYPERRSEYVASMHGALREGGEVVGLFWHHSMEGGPPFDITPDEVRAQFGDRFELSDPVWLGALQNREREWVIRMRKR